MTVLSLLQAAAREIHISAPSEIVASTNEQVQQLLAHTHRVGDRLASEHQWPQLSKEFTITLVDSQDSYALPADFDRFITRTHWDRTNQWELQGPLSASEWQWFQSGVVSDFPRRRFRIKGMTDNKFFIHPTPDSSEAGNVLAFEYQSKNWISPVTWTTATAFGAGAYCSYNGNIYKTTAGGTTGVTEPTHTTGSSSDGGVTWTFQDITYDSFLADTDFSLIDERTLGLGVQVEFMKSSGLQYLEKQRDFQRQVQRQAIALKGTQVLRLDRSVNPRFLSPGNVSDTGYGS